MRRALREPLGDGSDDGTAAALRMMAEEFDLTSLGIAVRSAETDRDGPIGLIATVGPAPRAGWQNPALARSVRATAAARPRIESVDSGSTWLLAPAGTEVVVLVAGPGARRAVDAGARSLSLCADLVAAHARSARAHASLVRRATVAELLAVVGAMLQHGGISEARELLDEVNATVARHVGARRIVTYELLDDRAEPLVQWGGTVTPPVVESLTAADVLRLERERVLALDAGADDLARKFCPEAGSCILASGIQDGRVVGIYCLVKDSAGPPRPDHLDLVVGVIDLLEQFRVRMGAELRLVRTAMLDQTRTEIAEDFVNAPVDELDDAIRTALGRIGRTFGVHRVRWIEFDQGAGRAAAVFDWSDGTRPPAPRSFDLASSVPPVVAGARTPFVYTPDDVERYCSTRSPHTTYVIPVVADDAVRGALTLTGAGVDAARHEDDTRTLVELARVIHQARLRADGARLEAYRHRLDTLQLRLFARFLDRSVLDAGPVLDAALAEIGGALDADVLAITQWVGTVDGEMHWWARDERAGDGLAMLHRSGMGLEGSELAAEIGQCLDTGRPLTRRSRALPADLRTKAEQLAGGEFSIIIVPFRAPGVALLLGVARFGEREWLEMETAWLQQALAQLRQFLEVVAGRSRLEYEATHDPLTGLANRRRINDVFGEVLASGRGGALLLIDVDRFKVVNDSLGHAAGDGVLRQLAERIGGAVREGDLVGRLGGDEFAVVVEGPASSLELAAEADRLVTVIREPMQIAETTILPTCSIGIAEAAPGDDAGAVLRHADAALYDAKALGRDRFAFFDDARRVSLRERLEIETELRAGIRRGEFVPWFQPEYDLVDGSMTGVEALVRWRHPARGLLEAGSFIDVAEEIGLAPAIGRVMLQQGCAVLRSWLEEDVETRLRVNVAAAQLQSRALVDEIRLELENHGIPAHLLGIEITERSLMLDPEASIETLRAVRELGVEVAVDDFGTGFSSLARLKDLPVDTLKIDRSFVSGIVDSHTDREIVRTIVGLGRGLGLDVVAEGVEHAEQVDVLVELGCRRAQGWLWSRAVPADAVPRLVRV